MELRYVYQFTLQTQTKPKYFIVFPTGLSAHFETSTKKPKLIYYTHTGKTLPATRPLFTEAFLLVMRQNSLLESSTIVGVL